MAKTAGTTTAEWGVPGPAEARERPTLVFDGDCGFCTAAMRWARRYCRPAVDFVPWQGIADLAAVGLTEQSVTESVQWIPVDPAAAVRSGAAAIGRLLLRSRWPWRPVGALILLPPVSWVAAVGYRMVSANRYRLPGGTPACATPVTSGQSATPGHEM